jgi:hypothetical protein
MMRTSSSARLASNITASLSVVGRWSVKGAGFNAVPLMRELRDTASTEQGRLSNSCAKKGTIRPRPYVLLALPPQNFGSFLKHGFR